MGTAFITEDGEAIEGEALEDIVVLGRVTYLLIEQGRMTPVI
jgi:DNA polymerase V